MIRKSFSRVLYSRAALMLSFLLLFLVLAGSGMLMAETLLPSTIGGVSPDEAIELGEKIYREGILPSGELMEAAVKGDVHMDGRMVTCANCHLRSGIGTIEGGVLTTPINGPSLYAPLSKVDAVLPTSMKKRAGWVKDEGIRPAYTDESLARVIWAGEDSAGKQINDVMPKYFLNDRDMSILVFYLKNLSSKQEPGVTATTLRFATVITDEVSKGDRDTMLSTLQFFINTWSGSTPMRAKGIKRGTYLDERMAKGYRKLSLAVWELKGPQDTWRSQLEEYYRKDPVFALLGGITTGEWAPIHRFCEDNRIPALYPITDYPVISENDWYTMYFSKGFAQEGEAAARYLNGRDDLPQGLPVVEIVRNTRAGLALSRAFKETWESYGRSAPEQIMLDEKEILSKNFWRKLSNKYKQSVVLMWLDKKDLEAIEMLAKENNRPTVIFLSWGLMKESVYSVPKQARSLVYVTYPYNLPKVSQNYLASVELMLKNNKVSVYNPEIAYKMASYFTILMDPLVMMRLYFYRDYFLDLVDMMPDVGVSMPTLYPRLSYGAGQRYASKGCYVVQLTDAPQPEMVKRSDWVIH